eukprot:scaffold3680_cov133-Isochrysis_galbana.AAC.1
MRCHIESGRVRGPMDRRGLGFSGPPGKARDDRTPLGKQPFKLRGVFYAHHSSPFSSGFASDEKKKQLRARVEGSRWRRSSSSFGWSPLRWFWPRTKVLRVPA